MSPFRSDWSGARCPIARSLDIVGDPWLLLILRDALCGTRRFDDFRRSLGIADNVLSKRLSAMVEAGLLVREPYRDGGRERFEYRLTEAGADLLPVLHALVLWGEKYTAGPTEERLEILHRTCGEHSRSADRCDHCGEELSAGNVAWTRPWRRQVVLPLVPVEPRA